MILFAKAVSCSGSPQTTTECQGRRKTRIQKIVSLLSRQVSKHRSGLWKSGSDYPLKWN